MAELRTTYGEKEVDEQDLMSHVMYPKVFEQYKADLHMYGDVTALPTRAFIEPMDLGEEIKVELMKGKTLGIKLQAVGKLDAKSGLREVFAELNGMHPVHVCTCACCASPQVYGMCMQVFFEFNGMPRTVMIPDRNAQLHKVVRPKAVAGDAGSVGAPMPGVVHETKVKPGEHVAAGEPMVILSAMKMETVVAAPIAGKVDSLAVAAGDDVQAGDLLVNIV